LRAVSSQTPSRSAISRFAVPAAASSTIRDRSTRRNGAKARRDTDSSSARSASPRQMTYGLEAMRPMVRPGPQGTTAIWPGHLSRPRPRCASGWPHGHASAGPSSPASPSATTASSPTSPASSPTAQPCPFAGSVTPDRHQLGLCHLPRQPRRLRQVRPAQRLPGRHPPGSPRLRLRPLPRRHYGLA